MAGDVLVNDQAVTKAGALIDDSAPISLKAATCVMSAEAGLKLEKALSEFSIELAGKTVLDVGASTGRLYRLFARPRRGQSLRDRRRLRPVRLATA